MARDRASRPLRLFVAFEPTDEARRAVASALVLWQGSFPRARWVPEENWHVTLKFLGRTFPRLEAWVREQVAAVAEWHAPVPTGLTGLGAFPTPSRARVVWAGLRDPGGRLSAIAEALDAALSAEFAPEQRAYSAHLTVARSDLPLKLPTTFVDTPVAEAAFTVDRLVLFRSHLRRPAPLYERLETFPLRGR